MGKRQNYDKNGLPCSSFDSYLNPSDNAFKDKYKAKLYLQHVQGDDNGYISLMKK